MCFSEYKPAVWTENNFDCTVVLTSDGLNIAGLSSFMSAVVTTQHSLPMGPKVIMFAGLKPQGFSMAKEEVCRLM